MSKSGITTIAFHTPGHKKIVATVSEKDGGFTFNLPDSNGDSLARALAVGFLDYLQNSCKGEIEGVEAAKS